jgi:hypothetical protein
MSIVLQYCQAQGIKPDSSDALEWTNVDSDCIQAIAQNKFFSTSQVQINELFNYHPI